MEDIAYFDTTSLALEKTAGAPAAAIESLDTGDIGIIAADADLQRWMNSRLFLQAGTSTVFATHVAIASSLDYNDFMVARGSEREVRIQRWFRSSAPFLLMGLMILGLFIATKVLPTDMARNLHTYVTYFNY